MTRHRVIAGTAHAIPDGVCAYCHAEAARPVRRNPAPPLHCARCGRHIGKTRTHYLTTGAVWCGRCVDREDRYDDAAPGSRAAIAHALGLWP